MSFSKNIQRFIKKHPVMRGMASYAVIWPVSSIIQQSLEGKRWGSYDWGRCFRYSLFGCFYVAPTLYSWLKISTALFPAINFKTALIKACVEQFTYGPFAMCSFFFGMSLLEQKSIDEACDEVTSKFLPTWKVGVCVWPVLQTINFAYIPERNRVPFVSICSLMWTSFLAYMKQQETQHASKSNGMNDI